MIHEHLFSLPHEHTAQLYSLTRLSLSLSLEDVPRAAARQCREKQAKQRTRAASEGLRRSRKISEGLDGLELQSEGSLCEGGVEGAVVLELGERELQRVDAGSVELLAW